MCRALASRQTHSLHRARPPRARRKPLWRESSQQFESAPTARAICGQRPCVQSDGVFKYKRTELLAEALTTGVFERLVVQPLPRVRVAHERNEARNQMSEAAEGANRPELQRSVVFCGWSAGELSDGAFQRARGSRLTWHAEDVKPYPELAADRQTEVLSQAAQPSEFPASGQHDQLARRGAPRVSHGPRRVL